MDDIEILFCKGVEGNCVYINNYRVVGPKPWGGYEIIKQFHCSEEDILTALKINTKEKDQIIAILEEELKEERENNGQFGMGA